MKVRFFIFFCVAALFAAQAQAAKPNSQQGATLQTHLLAAPGSTASDADIADFLLTCASAHADSAFGSELLTGKHDDDQTHVAQFYIVVAEAYSSKDYAKKKWTQLRDAAGDRMKHDSTGTTFAQGMAGMLSDDQAQMVECANYTRGNKASIDARVRQSGILKQQAKPN